MRPRTNIFAGFGSILWLIVVGVPLYVVLSASLQPRSSYLKGGPLSLPSSLTLENYASVFQNGFLLYLLNTVLVGIGVVALVLVLVLPLAYGVVRGRGRINMATFRVFLLGLAIPSQAVIIPLFLLINQLGLYDTLWAIILPTAAFSLPVSVLILTGSMRDISNELYEAMTLDGASPSKIFFTLVLPLSKSGISTIAVFTALQAWNGFLFPLILTQSQGTKVVTLGLFTFINQYGANVPGLLAAVILSALPILVVYLFARRALVSGLMGVGGK
ncbi:carbohydrate ABC transporter permease [Subtercola frigoramans]|uniref:Xylobiose transport system permease protein n=1 Tax=Subtercola frigoramans TaxID=120298 RepID=A0ABS2L089_9MICO|nr:carbohydrate ABC transporter permease [Subtercola frigoramans]MBM7470469.1 xylobiose transport system permease protein [Subtercola frigoramans]